MGILISAAVLFGICWFVWWVVPVILPDSLGVKKQHQIAAVVIVLIVLSWFGGGFGYYAAPWTWDGPRRLPRLPVVNFEEHSEREKRRGGRGMSPLASGPAVTVGATVLARNATTRYHP